MNRYSQNQDRVASREETADVANVTRFRNDGGVVVNWVEASRIATECLRQTTRPKVWCIELGVTPRTIQRWVSGEVAVSKEYIVDIICIAKGYFLMAGMLEAAVDRMMLAQLGHKVDF